MQRRPGWSGPLSGSAPSLRRVLRVAEAPPPPVALGHREALPAHRLHQQLHHAGRLRHRQLRHSEQGGVGPAHQDPLPRGGPGVGPSQPAPVHPEVSRELRRVLPAQRGVQAQAGAAQPHHVVHTQALHRERGDLEISYVKELRWGREGEREREGGREGNLGWEREETEGERERGMWEGRSERER